MKEVLRGFRKNRASTDPAASDPRLRGRTYTIPFEEVWQASVSLCGGGMRGWSIVIADDRAGEIDALSKAPIIGLEVDVWIQIGLDEDAQTRIDVQGASRTERTDLGLTKRTVASFFRKLDKELAVRPTQILDPTTRATWRETS